MDKYNDLRNNYPIFIYDSYKIKENLDCFEVTYNFYIPSLTEFHPRWVFPKPQDSFLTDNEKAIFEKAIFNLGMVEVISYLKATCSPKLIVNAGSLNLDQIKWYKKLFVNGLGEFFYRNGLEKEMNEDTFIEIKSKNKKSVTLTIEQNLKGNLIPVGGGKDSALTLEVLKDMDNICYIVNPRGASMGTVKIAGYEDKVYTPKRTIDSNLLELNKEGFLNGHTPFSAILAFSSYASSIICKRKYIVLSNEASANEANVKGTNINHQYSKSIEFENDFREYVKAYICSNGPEYFSLLRPLTEWQIVKNFIKEPKYFEVFKSCNVGSKQDIWCENCPKCLYVYIMLKAFLDDEKMKRIFKSDMLDDENLENIFNGLVYPNYDKPFECVGTKEEINLSLNMIVKKYNSENKKLPKLLQKFTLNIDNLEQEIEKFNNYWNYDNNLDNIFIKRLKEYMK